MKKVQRPFHLSITHRKILETVRNLNQKRAFPTVEGVAKILNGVNDFETKNFSETSTFATLLSYRGRKLTAMVTNLHRRGYLFYVYEENDNSKFLKITTLGEAALLSHSDNEHKPYRRKEKKPIITILYK